MLEFTEGKIVNIPYTAEKRDGSGTVEAGTDCKLKIYDETQDEWWDGAVWDVETVLTMTHLTQGEWEYEWEIPTGIRGHDIRFIRYNTVDGCVEVSDTVTIEATGKTGSYAPNVKLVDGDAQAVPMVAVVVRDESENIVFGRDTTDEDGLTHFELDAGTYAVRCGPSRNYQFNNPYTVVVSDAMDNPIILVVETATLAYEGLSFGEMKSQISMALLDVYSDRLHEELIAKFIQQGHLETDMYVKWTRDEEHLVSVTGQHEYNMHGSRRNIVVVTCGDDGRIVEEVEFEKMLALMQSPSSGSVAHWATWGNKIFFHPAPAANDIDLCLWIVRAPIPLVCDGDIPDLPAELHQAIVDYGLSRAYIHLEDTLTADEYQELWQTALDRWTADVKEYRSGRVRVQDVEDF